MRSDGGGFPGAYSQQNGSGTAHYADSRVEPGKKIFTWGWGAHGMGMSRQYTDNGSQYVELQAGLSQDQETFTFLEPHQAVHFTEYWMPVRGIGGISRVNPDAVVYLERSGQTLNVALQVYRTFPGSKLRIVQGGQAVLQETVNLDPAKNLSRQIPARAGLKYTVEVRDGAGALILSHTEDSYAGVDGAKAKDVQPRQAAKTPTTEAEFLKAGDEDRLRNLLVAYQTIQAGLAKFPRSAALNKAAGRLAVGLNRFEEAVQWLSKGPSDAETHYYLGLAYVQMSYVPRACQEFEAARNDPRFGPAAGFELAQSKALLGDLKAALAELEETLKADAGMPGAGALEVALLRNLKRTGDASQRLEYWLARDPGYSALRYEATRLGKADEALWRHLAADPDRVLDIATGYVRAGLYRDALDVLGPAISGGGSAGARTRDGAAAGRSADHLLPGILSCGTGGVGAHGFRQGLEAINLIYISASHGDAAGAEDGGGSQPVRRHRAFFAGGTVSGQRASESGSAGVAGGVQVGREVSNPARQSGTASDGRQGSQRAEDL